MRPTPQDVTSAHLNLPDNGLSAPGRVWGNGPDYSGPGPIIGSCRNPHGMGVPHPNMTPSIKPLARR